MASATASSFPPHHLLRRRHSSGTNACLTTSLPFSRRILLLSATAVRTSTFLLPQSPAYATTPDTAESDVRSTTNTTPTPPTITDRVFLDFSLCPSYYRPDRPLGSDLGSCPDTEPLGRVVFGLYGKLVPVTVANFKAMCTSASYKGALVHKVLQGQYFSAGKQGRKDKGEVRVPLDLARNTETIDAKAFQLTHTRPGTLSLCLSENDDYEDVRLDPEYRNVEFLVTTGPGPCPQLDNENIVFGTVLEGSDVHPTFNVADLTHYYEADPIQASFAGTSTGSGVPPQPLVRSSGDDQITQIIDDRSFTSSDGTIRQFLVRWAHRPDTDDTWISETELQ